MRWSNTVRIVALLAVLTSGTATATANTIYNWQGTCTFGCTGIASGILTLTDDAGGPFDFDIPQFISWQYTSSNGTYFLDNSPSGLYAKGFPDSCCDVTFLENGGLGPQTPGTYYFAFVAVIDSRPGVGNAWNQQIGLYGDRISLNCSNNVYTVWDCGVDFAFAGPVAPTPLPATLPLFASGLGLMGWLAWRKKSALL